MDSKRIFRGGMIFGVVMTLMLLALTVTRHPASTQGAGRVLFLADLALLLVYAIAGVWGWQQRRTNVLIALSMATPFGFAAGAVLTVNHVIEVFMPSRPFAFVIFPVLLIFVLLGTAGSVAWQRTRSVARAVGCGVWCSMIAMIVLLCFVLLFNLIFPQRAELWLHDAFVASGLKDEAAFLVNNTLEAASEGLVRLPIVAIFLSAAGALANYWISGRTRNTAMAVAVIMPVLFAIGVAALWYANTLDRTARPPFVMFGILSAGIALCCVHPAWSALRAVKP